MQANFEEIEGYPVKPGGTFIEIIRLYAIKAYR